MAQPRAVPREEKLTAGSVGVREQEVHHRVAGVDFPLVVVDAAPLGVEEHLKVVFLPDDGVALPEPGCDVGLFERGSNIEVVGVPQQPGRGGIFRPRMPFALNVYKQVGAVCPLPVWFIEPTVDGDGAVGRSASIDFRLGELVGEAYQQAVFCREPKREKGGEREEQQSVSYHVEKA